MSRYIKAKALIDDLLDLAEANKGTYHEEGFKNAITVVEMQPTADVVEVVRCKDCKYWDTEWWVKVGDKHYCELIDGFRTENWFCADGERGEDG